MKRLAVIGLTVLVAFATSGCGGGGFSASSAVVSSGSAKASASAENASSLSSDSVLLSSFEWPEKEFGDLPEPETEAKIFEVNEADDSIKVMYRDMKESEVAAYVDVMKSLGYTEDVSEKKSETTYSYMASRTSEELLMDTAIIVYEIDEDSVAKTTISRLVLK